MFNRRRAGNIEILKPVVKCIVIRQAFVCTHPQPVFTVVNNSFDNVTSNRVMLFAIVSVNLKRVSVKAVQPIIRRYPHEAITVLRHVEYRGLRHPFFHAYVGKDNVVFGIGG